MNYITFPQARTYMQIPAEGRIDFMIDGGTAVTCVELTERDIEAIRKNKHRLFILTPVMPTQDRPVYVKLMARDPFLPASPNLKINGKDKD